MTRLGVAAVALAMSAVACTGPAQSPAVTPSQPSIPLGAGAAGHVVVLEDLTPRWGPRPDQLLLDMFGENQFQVTAGRRGVLLGEEADGPGGTWVRTWIAPDPTMAPGDFFAWLPTTIDGHVALRLEPLPPCPGDIAIESLAALLPFDRLRCLGSAPITFEAATWLSGTWPTYDAEPAWYGTTRANDRSVALFAQGLGRPPDPAVPWVEGRTPPGIDVPPPEFVLRLSGAFDHVSAAGCRRAEDLTVFNPPRPPGAGMPIEAPDDSVLWCRAQFVISGWEIVAGPEGRPYDAAQPQLHRVNWPEPPPGVITVCGGVGMPPLRMRVDPRAIDPVWIETGPGQRSIATFGPEFRLELAGVPRVTAPGGVEIFDGDVINPDRGRPNLSVCPGGAVVTFQVPAGPA